MHTTIEQNRDHRNSATWIKSNGRDFQIDGENYISEYLNTFTGQAIRKSWRLTGHDWHLWDSLGRKAPTSYTTLTVAKYAINQEYSW